MKGGVLLFPNWCLSLFVELCFGFRLQMSFVFALPVSIFWWDEFFKPAGFLLSLYFFSSFCRSRSLDPFSSSKSWHRQPFGILIVLS